MVRLGDMSLMFIHIQMLRFNSIMVRLGEPGKGKSMTLSVFQFHHGAIGRLLFWAVRLGMVCFNSIMVRLGVHLNRHLRNLLYSFNSIMVRLGA